MDSKERFSQRVEDYVKYRPSYPEEMILKFKELGIISNNKIVADLGSGTGILSKLLLPQVQKIFAVEPNKPMRKAAEHLLGDYENFISLDGSGEATSLAENSIDSIFAAQAFHWFDMDKAACEFSRILKKAGYVVLIWNERLTEKSEFLRGYDKLLQEYATDYNQVNHTKFTYEVLEDFFAPNQMQYLEFPYYQQFNWEQTLGRLNSCSYCPEKATYDYRQLTSRLRKLYETNNTNGIINFAYKTRVFYAKWS